MIISFDIDNTLIPYSDEFEVEYVPAIFKYMGIEPIRKGTIELIKQLQKANHEFWIYSTSYRSKLKIYLTFKYFGIPPAKIINGQLNFKTLLANNCKASKNPQLFSIDLHVDDLKGVFQESEMYNFSALIIDTFDERWTNKVLHVVS